MRKPSVFEASKLNGGYLGGAGHGRRHRFDLSGMRNAKPKKPKDDMGAIPDAEPDESDANEVKPPGKSKGLAVTIAIHHANPSQLQQMSKMQKGRRGGY